MARQQESPRAAATAPQTPPPPGVRMAGDERRRQIVRVAMRLFSERGFRGTTTKEIAQAAGVSEAIIFRHFATKDELYSAIIDHKGCAPGEVEANRPVAEFIRGEVGEALARKDDRAVFEGIALAMLRHQQEEPEFLRLLLYSALEGHQLAQMFWERNVRALYEFLGSYIRERQRDGVFGEVDPHVVVRAFSGTLIHHTLSNTLWDKSRSLLAISDEEAARQFTEILLSGVRNARAEGTKPARAKNVKRASGAGRVSGKKKSDSKK